MTKIFYDKEHQEKAIFVQNRNEMTFHYRFKDDPLFTVFTFYRIFKDLVILFSVAQEGDFYSNSKSFFSLWKDGKKQTKIQILGNNI